MNNLKNKNIFINFDILKIKQSNKKYFLFIWKRIIGFTFTHQFYKI